LLDADLGDTVGGPPAARFRQVHPVGVIHTHHRHQGAARRLTGAQKDGLSRLDNPEIEVIQVCPELEVARCHGAPARAVRGERKRIGGGEGVVGFNLSGQVVPVEGNPEAMLAVVAVIRGDPHCIGAAVGQEERRGLQQAVGGRRQAEKLRARRVVKDKAQPAAARISRVLGRQNHHIPGQRLKAVKVHIAAVCQVTPPGARDEVGLRAHHRQSGGGFARVVRLEFGIEAGDLADHKLTRPGTRQRVAGAVLERGSGNKAIKPGLECAAGNGEVRREPRAVGRADCDTDEEVIHGVKEAVGARRAQIKSIGGVDARGQQVLGKGQGEPVKESQRSRPLSRKGVRHDGGRQEITQFDGQKILGEQACGPRLGAHPDIISAALRHGHGVIQVGLACRRRGHHRPRVVQHLRDSDQHAGAG